MRHDVSSKESALLREASDRVEQSLRRVEAALKAGDLWANRRAERDRLKAEIAATVLDPLDRSNADRLRELAEKQQQYEMLNKLLDSHDPATETPRVSQEDKTALAALVLDLASITWQCGEPRTDFDFAAVRACGLVVPESNYSPAAARQRLESWAHNFPLEAAEVAVRMARRVASRRFPRLTPDFGTSWRPLTPAEKAWLDKNTATLEEAA